MLQNPAFFAMIREKKTTERGHEMGRAGRGGGGGGRSFSGHSISRGTSSHRPSGGRAGSNRSGSGRPPNYAWGGSSLSGGWVPRRRVAGRGTIYGAYRSGTVPAGSGGSGAVIVLVVFVILMFLVAMAAASGGSVPASTYAREKLENGRAFDNDCIVDELGWFDNESRTERQLQDFFDKTGVQPYIVLRAYDANLTMDEEKDAFAQEWYDQNLDNECSLLFMYFAERNADLVVGYMVLVNGKQVSSVMDSEAIEIFWAYVDTHWYSDLSTDEMFLEIFDDTAGRIMQKTTTAADVWKTALIVGGVVAVCCLGIYFYKLKKKKDKEEDERTRRILETPLGDLAEDETLKKYE